jgi:hypothetical protein
VKGIILCFYTYGPRSLRHLSFKDSVKKKLKKDSVRPETLTPTAHPPSHYHKARARGGLPGGPEAAPAAGAAGAKRGGVIGGCDVHTPGCARGPAAAAVRPLRGGVPRCVCVSGVRHSVLLQRGTPARCLVGAG